MPEEITRPLPPDTERTGEVIVFLPPIDRHQELVGFLYEPMATFVRLFQLGVIRVAPLEMRLDSSLPELDVLFVEQEHRARLTEQRLEDAAHLSVWTVIGWTSFTNTRRLACGSTG